MPEVYRIQHTHAKRMETFLKRYVTRHTLNQNRHEIKTIVCASVSLFCGRNSRRRFYTYTEMNLYIYALHYVLLDNLGFLMGYEPFDI